MIPGLLGVMIARLLDSFILIINIMLQGAARVTNEEFQHNVSKIMGFE